MIWQANNIVKQFKRQSGLFSHVRHNVLAGLSLCVGAGETVGLVGESGSGKTTLARIALMLDKADGGQLHLDGMPYESYQDKISIYQKIQMVFQHSSEALNPRLSVRDIIEEPLRYLTPLTGPARLQRTKEMLEAVRLEAGLLAAKPPELSGGQAQRVGLARALAPAPRLVILDEPTSSLDIIIQRQILSLLGQLPRQTGMAFLMISHDLGAVCQVADRIAFIHDGRIVEQAASRAIDQVRHPIARRLVRSAVLLKG